MRGERFVLGWRWFALTAALASLTLTGCSSDGTAQASRSPSPTPSVLPATTDDPTPSPTPSPSLDTASLVRTVTTSATTLESVCGVDGGNSPEVSLLPGGLAVARCQNGTVAVLNAVTGSVLWTQTGSVDPPSVIAVGTRHVFVMDSVRNDASDLKNSYVSRKLTALDLQTGDSAWTVDIEGWIPEADRGDVGVDLGVVESGGGDSGLAPQVAVRADGWTGLDADTGKELWHAADLDPFAAPDSSSPRYVGDGVVLSLGDGAIPVWSAVDAVSRAKLWSVEVPSASLGEDISLVDTTLWQQSRSGILAVDVRSGKIALSRKFPAEWLGAVADRSVALVSTSGKLQLVRIQDPRSPVWAVPAGSVTPLAVSEDTAVVAAESGVQLLDAKTGELIGSAPVDDSSPDGWDPVVDGMVRLSDGSIFMLSPPRETT